MMELKVQTKEEGVHYDEKGFLYVNDKIFYDLPKSELFINVRIVNDGNIPVDILNIYSNCEAYNTPFTFYSGHVLLENNAVDYPQHLEPGQIFLCQIKHDIDNGLGTTAQFAASLRNVKNEVSNSILIDLLDKNGNRKKLELSSKFSIRPLVDLSATQWQSFQQHDLLELAGIGSR